MSSVRLHGQIGISLIEVLISLTIGLFVISFGFTALISINNSFVLIKNNAKMQETARFAHQLISRDIQRSRYWHNIMSFSEFSGSSPLYDADSKDCIENNNSWGRQLQQPIFALNNTTVGYNCTQNDFYLTGDILTLRYPDITPVTKFDNEQLYLRSNNASHKIFVGAKRNLSFNSQFPKPTFTQQVVSHSYFIGNTQRTCKNVNIPALYWQTLVNARPQKEELLTGIEQLQLTFLIDENLDGVGDKYTASHHSINWHAVMSVSVELLIRSDCPDFEFVNNKVYQLGDITFKANDNFHRQHYRFAFRYQ